MHFLEYYDAAFSRKERYCEVWILSFFLSLSSVSNRNIIKGKKSNIEMWYYFWNFLPYWKSNVFRINSILLMYYNTSFSSNYLNKVSSFKSFSTFNQWINNWNMYIKTFMSNFRIQHFQLLCPFMNIKQKRRVIYQIYWNVRTKKFFIRIWVSK